MVEPGFIEQTAGSELPVNRGSVFCTRGGGKRYGNKFRGGLLTRRNHKTVKFGVGRTKVKGILLSVVATKSLHRPKNHFAIVSGTSVFTFIKWVTNRVVHTRNSHGARDELGLGTNPNPHLPTGWRTVTELGVGRDPTPDSVFVIPVSTESDRSGPDLGYCRSHTGRLRPLLVPPEDH